MKKNLLFIFLFFNLSYSFSQIITSLSKGTFDDSLLMPYGPIRSLFTDTIDNVLYAGGDFVFAGGIRCYGIAKWDGSTWSNLGLGLKANNNGSFVSHVRDIVRFKNEIYVTGNFRDIGGKKINGLARWNGVEWNSVDGILKDNGLDGFAFANALEVYNNELYVIGDFDSIGTMPSKGIAKWDGMIWTDLSQNFNVGCQSSNKISTLKFFNNELFVAGNVNCIGNVEEKLSKRVGNNWVDVGPGFNGDCWINKLTIYQNNLYIGGYFFTTAGNVDNSMVYTDGINFFPTAGGVLPSNNRDMFEYQNELYVCGQINFAGFQPINRIAKWDGIQWINTGLSIESYVTSVGTLNNFAEYNGKLVVAGSFTSINGVPANNIAMVDFTVGISNLKPNSIFKIYPNPTNTTFTVQAKDLAQLKSIQVYNALGKLVLTQKAEIENMIDVSGFSKGLYIVEVRTDKGVASEKLMVE